MVLLPVKPLGPFEHVHEGKSKWFKFVDQFYDVLFLTSKILESLAGCLMELCASDFC